MLHFYKKLDGTMVVFIIGFFALLFGYFPGRVLIEFFPLKSKEKFVVSFGVTFFIYYLIGFFVYIANLPLYFLYTLLILLFIAISLLTYKKYKPFPNEFTFLGIFMGVFIVILSYQGLLPYYAGGQWYFDWFEHFQRVRFFLEQLPLDTRIGPYLITARPPLFNVVTYVYQSVIGKEFWEYQIMATLLNTTVLLACWLIITLFTKRSLTFLLMVLSAALLLNPSFIIQTTFTWTKALSVYYLLTGFYFYLQFRQGKSPLYLFLGTSLLGAAYLTHYSTAPFIFGIGCDWLLQAVRTPKLFLKQFGVSMIIFVVILSSWYFWAISHYGLYQSFMGNTAYEWQRQITPKERVIKDITNLKNTLVPTVPQAYIRLVEQQDNYLVALYDILYGFYATKLVGNLTVTLTVIIFVYSIVQFRRQHLLNSRQIKSIRPGNLRRVAANILEQPNTCWWWFLFVGIILGLIAIPSRDLLGFAHVAFLPISFLLICFATVSLIYFSEKKRLFLSVFVIVGMLVEAVIGIGLRLYVSRHDLNPAYLIEMGRADQATKLLPEHSANYVLKTTQQLNFLADQFSSAQTLFLCVVIAGMGLSWLFLVNSFFIRRR